LSNDDEPLDLVWDSLKSRFQSFADRYQNWKNTQRLLLSDKSLLYMRYHQPNPFHPLYQLPNDNDFHPTKARYSYFEWVKKETEDIKP
jgi:hypothetical protein